MKSLQVFFFCLVLAVSLANSEEAPAFKSGVFDPPRIAPDFSLPGSRGETVTLSKLKGKVVILGFGFSHCPDVCPITLATLTQAYKNLGDLAAKIQIVYMTVDPERDTVERLREYMSHFNPEFIGITGSAEQLAEVRKAYGILAAKKVHNDGSYEVHHSSYLYLIDQQGLLRTLIPFGKAAGDITHDVKLLLQEKPVLESSSKNKLQKNNNNQQAQ